MRKRDSPGHIEKEGEGGIKETIGAKKEEEGG